MTKFDLYNQIKTAFNMDDEQAEAACVLLEARAESLDYTLDEYLDRYHPKGVAERDEALDGEVSAYIQFLGGDAAAVIKAGRSANFSTFVHECAHAFRRQLAGELLKQAETAWGIKNGKWSREKEEEFADGLVIFIEKRRYQNELEKNVLEKGADFVGRVYRGVEHIIDIDPKMEAVYEKLFEPNEYKLDQKKYEELLSKVAAGKKPKESHVVLGLTPRIYEELGFERLPMAITNKHLYTTLLAGGRLHGSKTHYHDLGKDILKQIPAQIKKPLLIIQDKNSKDQIISIIELRDKQKRPIIIPIAQMQRGNNNGLEIDINLVKSIYGRTNFDRWLGKVVTKDSILYEDKKRARKVLGQNFDRRLGKFVKENSLSYEDKKRTGKALDQSLITNSSAPSFLASDHNVQHHQDVSGFYIHNIASYREAVKLKFPERFKKEGIERLESRRVKLAPGQILFDFDNERDMPAAVKTMGQETNKQEQTPPSRAAADKEYYDEYLKATEKRIAEAQEYLEKNRPKISAEKEQEWERTLAIHQSTKKFVERRIGALEAELIKEAVSAAKNGLVVDALNEAGYQTLLKSVRERHPALAECVGKGLKINEEREREAEREREQERRKVETQKALKNAGIKFPAKGAAPEQSRRPLEQGGFSF